ncbi:TonB-dependent receptor [Cytophagales bacterium LB-30]|uniref:TonB-dependent receptor n=1 Tax=Shiella aurantiaca TaxID=3058365 RepID=A0ABT8F648_9BACT|nr:TonB-dependent receptor [Shiella aurantiaca]MDN4165783.1 TonB-dependent receptor [Shiella aurantiaca]
MATESEPSRGLVIGKVIDAITKEPLPGATIRAVNSNYGAASDLAGEFELVVSSNVKAIEIRYIGYENVILDIEVEAGAITLLENAIEMKAAASNLSEVVITGVLQGQQKALNQQKSADNIKNIVAADQIGRFPDPNVAEALQRIPGTNIERDQGEGRYVLVRGLAPQFTNISINGEQVPSPEAGVRYVALDAVPADQLASIEVTKALTPDMDGDAVGGSVNLITRTAKSSRPTVSGSLVGGYNNILQTPNLQGSLELGKRFGQDDKLGIMLNSSYYETDRGSDNWETDTEELELRDYALVRTRMGISSTIDYKFNTNNELYFRTLYNRFTDREQRRRYVFVPNLDNSPFESHEIERLTKDRLEKQIVSSFNLGGKHSFPNLFLDYEVAFSEAYQDTPFDVEVGFVGEVDDLSIDYSNPEFPSFNINGKAHTDATNDYLNNSLYEFDELTSGNTFAYDANRTAKFNIGIPYQLASAEALVKFGAKARWKEKSYRIIENVYSWEGGDVTFNGTDGEYTLDRFQGGLEDNNFLNGRFLIQPNVDTDQVITHFNANKNGYELSVDDKLAAEAAESYTATEDVYAAYAMTKIQLQKLMLLGGVRFEQTTVNYTFSNVFYDFEGELEEITPDAGSTKYSYILPQVHAKYQLDANTNLRAAITASYSRPNFEQIVPTQEIDLNGREGSIGNPNLKPVSAINFDLLGEHYFGTVGILSGGVFYKQLNDFIFNQRFVSDEFNGRDLGANVQFTQSQNGESANLMGIEIGYQQNLSFLPGVFKGLGVYANYTFTDSRATIQDREDDNGTEEIRLPGQTKHLGNFSLAYDLNRLNFRISANFNGEYISEIGGSKDEDIYVKDRVQLDATATYAFSNKFRVFGEFMNITNQPFEVYMGNENTTIQREFYSWWARIGIKFDL